MRAAQPALPRVLHDGAGDRRLGEHHCGAAGAPHRARPRRGLRRLLRRDARGLAAHQVPERGRRRHRRLRSDLAARGHGGARDARHAGGGDDARRERGGGRHRPVPPHPPLPNPHAHPNPTPTPNQVPPHPPLPNPHAHPNAAHPTPTQVPRQLARPTPNAHPSPTQVPRQPARRVAAAPRGGPLRRARVRSPLHLPTSPLYLPRRAAPPRGSRCLVARPRRARRSVARRH